MSLVDCSSPGSALTQYCQNQNSKNKQFIMKNIEVFSKWSEFTQKFKLYLK